MTLEWPTLAPKGQITFKILLIMEKVDKGAKTGMTQSGRLTTHFCEDSSGEVNQHLMML